VTLVWSCWTWPDEAFLPAEQTQQAEQPQRLVGLHAVFVTCPYFDEMDDLLLEIAPRRN
jgi:hypothetical protein